MAQNQSPGKADLGTLESRFTNALDWCQRLWDSHAFQRPVTGGWRDQALAGMYDAQMVAVTLLSDQKLKALNAKQVQSATRDLFDDEQFEVAVREGTNTPQRIRYRISELAKRLRS